MAHKPQMTFRSIRFQGRCGRGIDTTRAQHRLGEPNSIKGTDMNTLCSFSDRWRLNESRPLGCDWCTSLVAAQAMKMQHSNRAHRANAQSQHPQRHEISVQHHRRRILYSKRVVTCTATRTNHAMQRGYDGAAGH
mgnify:CR=1 FL=1